MKVGRPAITIEDLPEGWKATILNEAREGAALIELAVLLGIHRETLTRLTEREKEFFDTINECKQLSEAWWVKQGRKQLENKAFSYTGWFMNMKNRFNWADKQQTEHKGNVGATINIIPPSE